MLTGCDVPQTSPVVVIASATPRADALNTPVVKAPATATIQPDCSVPYFEPVALLPNDKGLLVKNEQEIFIVDTNSWKPVGTFEVPIALDSVVALSPDGRLLAFTHQQENTIQLVNMEDGKVINTLSGHTSLITNLKFTPTSDKLLSSAHDGWVRVWDTQGNLVDSFQPTGADNFPSEVLGMAISPDGAMLATIPFDGPVKLWEMRTHAEIREMGGSGGYDTSDVAFSPDGEYLASDLATGLWVWRVSDGSLVLNGINTMAFAFSPTGHVIAYSDIDQNSDLILFSLDRLQRLHRLQGNNGWLTFFADGSQLMSTNGMETWIWQVDNESLLSIACN
jgi:WD40 repeat protein